MRFAMSNLRFSRVAIENIILLLIIDIESREITQIYRYHASTMNKIKQNVVIFRDSRSIPCEPEKTPLLETLLLEFSVRVLPVVGVEIELQPWHEEHQNRITLKQFKLVIES